jgi:hypothetical protein
MMLFPGAGGVALPLCFGAVILTGSAASRCGVAFPCV